MDIRPKTAEQYIDLIDQALFEISDLRATAEFDGESMSGATEFLGRLEHDIAAIRQSMVEGRYQFGDSDLPFMKIVERQDDRVLPFKYLLRMINATHRLGLDVEGE